MWNGASGDFMENDLNVEESQSTIDNLMEHAEQIAQNVRASTENPCEKDVKTVSTSFRLLEDHTFIEYMDADEVFIVTAENRSDRDIKVWDVANGECVKLLSGHIGPITGVKLQRLNLEKPDSRERLVVSSSEDGTIRQWSIEEGKEIRTIISTANIFTCMETYGRSLVVAGNNKGVLEIYHQLTGQLHAKEKAHEDSIDALFVGDNSICTAVYGDTSSSLKVWTLKWGQIVPVYNFDSDPSLDFRPFALSDDTIVLGSTMRQELHFLDFVSEDRTSKVLHQGPGSVTALGLMENLIFATTVNGSNMVHLHVYVEKGMEHLLTFHCKNMNMVTKIIVLRNETTLKFVLGGSALKILELDFTAEKAKEVDTMHKDPEKIMNIEDRSEKMNDLTKESTITEKLNNEEDKVTSQTTSSLTRLNIEPTHSKNVDKVQSFRDDSIRRNLPILPPLNVDMAEIRGAHYRKKVLDLLAASAKKKALQNETNLNNFDQDLIKKKVDSKSKTQIKGNIIEENSQKAILDADTFRKEAQGIEPRGVKKYSRLVIRDRAEGDARKEEKGEELSGIAAGGEDIRLERKARRPSVRKERPPDFVFDITDETTGCFRKKKKVKSSKLERGGNKKCAIM